MCKIFLFKSFVRLPFSSYSYSVCRSAPSMNTGTVTCKRIALMLIVHGICRTVPIFPFRISDYLTF